MVLQYFINLLESALNGTFTDSMLPINILNKEKELENLLDYNKMKNFWEVKTLVTICDLYDNCFKTLNDSEIPCKKRDAIIKGYLKSVNSTLEITDKDFKTLINNSRKG